MKKPLYAITVKEYYVGPLRRIVRDDRSQAFIGVEFLRVADCEYWEEVTGWIRARPCELYFSPPETITMARCSKETACQHNNNATVKSLLR